MKLGEPDGDEFVGHDRQDCSEKRRVSRKARGLQEKREEHRERYEAKKEAFNEKYEVPVSERPSLARLTKADIFKLVGLGLFFVLMAGVCVLIAPWISELSEPDGLQRVLEDVRNAGVGGVFILLAFQFLQIVVAFIPGEVVQIAAGMMYGPWIGALVVIVGAVISSAFIFAIVHKLGAPFVRAMIPEKWMNKLERFENSEKLDVMVFILFLIPGLPKDVFTYLVPLTNMSMRNFVVLANVGRIPACSLARLAPTKLIEGDYGQSAILFGIAAVIGILAIWQHDRILHIAAKLGLSKRRELSRRNKRIRKMRGAVCRARSNCYT